MIGVAAPRRARDRGPVIGARASGPAGSAALAERIEARVDEDAASAVGDCGAASEMKACQDLLAYPAR